MKRLGSDGGAFVSWSPFVGRSQGFIDALGLFPVYVHYLRGRDPLAAPFKYGPQFLVTLASLFRRRPSIVFVMDPPVFAPLAAYLYCCVSGARLVMDCHSGVFEGRKWLWALPIQKRLARYAAAVIITNSKDERTVKSWGATPLVVGDPPPILPLALRSTTAAKGDDNSPRCIVVVNRYAEDEAVEEVLLAAAKLPSVRFLITGDSSRARPGQLKSAPANVVLTGWLPLQEYWRALAKANIVMTLTTQDNAILRGAWEAMYLGQPLITSRSGALCSYFSRGAIFVENSAEGISVGVREALLHEAELRIAMSALRDEKYQVWRQDREGLEALLGVQFARS